MKLRVVSVDGMFSKGITETSGSDKRVYMASKLSDSLDTGCDFLLNDVTYNGRTILKAFR